jgi:hypothetical protein
MLELDEEVEAVEAEAATSRDAGRRIASDWAWSERGRNAARDRTIQLSHFIGPGSTPRG